MLIDQFQYNGNEELVHVRNLACSWMQYGMVRKLASLQMMELGYASNLLILPAISAILVTTNVTLLVSNKIILGLDRFSARVMFLSV